MPNYYRDPKKRQSTSSATPSRPSSSTVRVQPSRRPAESSRVQSGHRTQQSRSHGNFRVDQQGDYRDRKFNQPEQMQPPRGNHRVSNQPSENWYQRRLKKKSHQQPGKLPKGRKQLFACYAVLFLAMASAAWAMMPFDRVNTVQLTGNQTLTRDDILTATQIQPMDKKEQVVEQEDEIIDLAKTINPLINDLTFETNDWRGLNIEVEESQVVGKIQQDGQLYRVLSNGVLLELEDNHTLVELPWIQDFNLEGLEKLGHNIPQINPTLLAEMDTIYYSQNPEKPHVIEVQMKDGNIVKASLATFAEKVQYYPEMKRQVGGQQGIYNLEVGAYFTPSTVGGESVKLDTNLDN
ncbi:hypothetical protein HZY86_01600 [Aerococcaceae bacterium DSM 111020]|nr:hypothetical protein [Aerococcaceae bacterium DSM 111020]